MSRSTLNSELLDQLAAISTETVMVDENGKALGIYKPINYAKLAAEVGNEELERLLAETTAWYTTEELIASLGTR